MKSATIILSAAGLLSIAGLCDSAAAQQYRNQGGTLLDRNQQVGGTGVNPRARDIRDQIWLNNAIITGNAPAGRSFRGYVGYTAPPEFRGVAGSDTNYTFRRDSTSAAQIQTGIRASDALRYQLSLTTGQDVPRYLAQWSTPRESNAATASTSTPTSAALRSTADYLTSRVYRPTLVGAQTDRDGNEWNATASPLLGVSWLRVNRDGPDSNKGTGENAPRISSDFALPDPNAGPPGSGPKALNVSGLTITPTGLESTSLGMQYQRRELEKKNPNAVDLTLPDTAVDRSVTHARVIAAMNEAYKPGDKSQDKPATDVTAPDTDSDKPKSLVEMELERVSRVLRGLPPTPPKAKPKPGEEDTTAPPAARPSPSVPGNQPATDDEDKDAKPLSPELIAALKAAGIKSLDSLVPREGILKDPEWYRAQMESGQRLLAEAQYFDAEDRFTRAIAAMPSDPLAKIGRVHAELGAGLFLSAAANLRSAIKAHPELAAMRFDSSLLPDRARIAVLADMLRANLAAGGQGMGSDSALLLAYLGHASVDQPMCVEGLKAFAQHTDPANAAELSLYQLLRALWTDGQDPAIPEQPAK